MNEGKDDPLPPDSGDEVSLKEWMLEQFGPDHPLTRPLTADEEERKRRREQLEQQRSDFLRSWSQLLEPDVEEANRFLYYHDGEPDELRKLRNLKPLGHHDTCPQPNSDPIVNTQHRRCWGFLLQPLRYWPSDLIKVYGDTMLCHPLILWAVRQLARYARSPRLRVNPDPVERIGRQVLIERAERAGLPLPDTFPPPERLKVEGWSAISKMEEHWAELALRDEIADPVRATEAKRELSSLADRTRTESKKGRPPAEPTP